jgi:hypothetical protein
MASLEPFTDREFRCERCAQRFVWTADAQYRFFLRGHFVPPSVCRPCRSGLRASSVSATVVPRATTEESAKQAADQAFRDKMAADLAHLAAVLKAREIARRDARRLEA